MKRTILFLFLYITSFSILTWGQQADVESLIQEGVALHDEGSFREAIDKYNQVLEQNPENIEATYEMSLSYLALEDYENASLYSTRVISAGNTHLSPGAYAVKSEALMGMGQMEEAIALLKEGLDKNGDQYLLHFNMALCYYKSSAHEPALIHIKKAIDLDKTHSGAFLLNAYLLNERGLWVQSILSFQMFLLLEPDSKRSRDAFEEMLYTMQIRERESKVERSFIQQQMMRSLPDSISGERELPPLSTQHGLNRNLVYSAITQTLDSLKQTAQEEDLYTRFKIVNREIIKVLEKESLGTKVGVFWTFYVPFFSHIKESTFFDTYSRYISVSYFPESLEWWQKNPETAAYFITWFEKGDNI